jgi:hypothetical protein
MAPPQRPPRREWPRSKTPAGRAEAAAELQKQLKREAAERREIAAAAKRGAAEPQQ